MVWVATAAMEQWYGSRWQEWQRWQRWDDTDGYAGCDGSDGADGAEGDHGRDNVRDDVRADTGDTGRDDVRDDVRDDTGDTGRDDVRVGDHGRDDVRDDLDPLLLLLLLLLRDDRVGRGRHRLVDQTPPQRRFNLSYLLNAPVHTGVTAAAMPAGRDDSLAGLRRETGWSAISSSSSDGEISGDPNTGQDGIRDDVRVDTGDNTGHDGIRDDVRDDTGVYTGQDGIREMDESWRMFEKWTPQCTGVYTGQDGIRDDVRVDTRDNTGQDGIRDDVRDDTGVYTGQDGESWRMFEKWTPQCCSDGRGSRGSVGAARPAGRDGLNDDVGRDGSDGARGLRGSIGARARTLVHVHVHELCTCTCSGVSAADTGLGTPARPAGRDGLNDDSASTGVHHRVRCTSGPPDASKADSRTVALIPRSAEQERQARALGNASLQASLSANVSQSFGSEVAGRDGSDGARGSRGSIDSEPEIEETASIDGAQGSRLSDIEGQLQEMAAIDGAQGSRGSDIEAWLAPPPVFFLSVFAPRPAGSPGSGVGRLDGWPQVPPAVTHEGPMPLVVWLARMNPPHFRCLADWLEHLEWVGFIRRYDVIVLTGRYDLVTV